MTNNEEKLKLKKLRSVSNDIELNMIKGILEDNKIQYIIKDYGPGGHMRIIAGGSPYAADIMVEESDLDEAMDLLKLINLGGEDGG